MIRKIRLIPVLTLVGGLILTSCKENSSSVDGTPPELPPASSMQMDFSTFEQDTTSQKAIASRSAEYEYFAAAAFTGGIMKLVVDVNLAIPRVLLAAAAETDPELNSDGEWEWSYSASGNGKNYGVAFSADYVEADDEATWKLFVTNDDLGLNEFLFFEGNTNGDGKVGSWTYYNLQSPDEEEAVSKVDWQVNGEEDVRLTLEVLSDREGHLGDSIEYRFDGTTKKAVYTDASDGNNVELEWNVETNAGFIIAPNVNGGDKACWGPDLKNTVCS